MPPFSFDISRLKDITSAQLQRIQNMTPYANNIIYLIIQEHF